MADQSPASARQAGTSWHSDGNRWIRTGPESFLQTRVILKPVIIMPGFRIPQPQGYKGSHPGRSLLPAAALGILLFLLALLVGRSLSTPPLKPSPEPSAAPDYSVLKSRVAAYLATLPGTNAVYFKDLASGCTFGINQNLPLPPASCIKVPVVLYLYQQVSEGKLHWYDRVPYVEVADYQSGAGALQLTARNGDTFSLRCLATVSITISDNIAHNMLVRYLRYDRVMSFIKNLGPHTTRPYGSAATTASDLGAFMEAVWRFSQEKPDPGGRLMDDLSHTIFHVGLPGELPTYLQVAHKEGSINGVANDMGIIYAKRPYLLVVMSKGITDEDSGFRNIARVSRMVYDYQQQLPAIKTDASPLYRQ